ncbi:hypothetical protein RCS94_02055 [Orbaceae bacterium ac157xtp]
MAYSLVNTAIIAALFAFSSQANEISGSFESALIVNKKNNNSVDEIDTNGSINALLEHAMKMAIKSSLNLCNAIDERYIELLNSPEKLSDEMYLALNNINDKFFVLDTLFKTAIEKQNDTNSEDKDNHLNEVYRSYKITCGKFNRLLSLAKQIKVVPNYVASDVDFHALKELTEHSNRVLAS